MVGGVLWWVYVLLLCVLIGLILLLVFVDSVKELFVILLLCLFNYNMLVMWVYEKVSFELLFEVVLVVLMICIVGLFVVGLFVWVNC